MNSASLCSLPGQYDNPLPTRFLAPIDCLKIPAQSEFTPFAGGKYLGEPKIVISWRCMCISRWGVSFTVYVWHWSKFSTEFQPFESTSATSWKEKEGFFRVFSVHYSTLFFLPCPSDSTVSEDAGIEQFRLRHWLSDALTTRLDLIHNSRIENRITRSPEFENKTRVEKNVLKCTALWEGGFFNL